MRLTFLLMTITFLSVHASTFSQSVTLSGKDLSLKKIFTAIEQQTGYVVFYNSELLKTAKPVTVAAEEMPLAAFLETAFKDQPLNYTITDKVITLAVKPPPLEGKLPFVVSAFIEVRGTVLNAVNKEPIASASVKIKGKNRGAITDAQGNFALNAEPGNVLVITSLQYETQEIKIIPNQPALTVLMNPAVSKLDETVVTAFGIEKSSKEVGYSVAKVSGADINRANSGNLLQGLAGKVSGLNIAVQSADMNPQMRVLIRGIRSFSTTSNNQPLFILNGTPLSFGSDNGSAAMIMDFINNINPADIENVTVLKGANGTALYGPEGVNGVIVITTKKGQKGKPAINFRNNVSFSRLDFRNDKSKQRRFGNGSGLVDDKGNGIYSSLDKNGWGPAYDGRLVPIGRADENGDYQMVTYSDKKDARRFFNVSHTIQNNLSISQSDAISDFYLGLSAVNATGMVPGDKQDAVNLFFSAGRKLGKLNVQLNLNYSRTNTDKGPEFTDMLSTPTFIPILSYKDYENDKWSDLNHYWNDNDVMSPYQAATARRKKGTDNAVIAGLILTGKVLPWLTVTDKPSIVYDGFYEKSTSQPQNFSDFAKQFGGYNRFRDRLSQLSEETRSNTTLNNDLLITALNHAGDFNFRTTLGSSVKENYYKKLGGSGNPIIPVFNLAFSRDPTGAGEESLLTRNYSFFGTSGIGYKDKVFVELMARNDWDSKRAKAGRGKDLYIGGNTSVILNEVISSLKNYTWLSRLQVRAAVNTTANMNIEPYQSERTLQMAYSNSFPYPGTSDEGVIAYEYLGGNPNPLLKPEKILSQEYGASVSLWKNRVSADFTWYTQRNNGVIMKVKIPWLSGGSTVDNLGIMRNYGWELDLKFDPVIKTRSGFSISADVRIAMNDNKVISISDVYDGLFPLKTPYYGSMYGIVARTGERAFEYQVYDLKRDAAGRVIVNKETGMPDVDMNNPIYGGRTLPKYSGGMNLNFAFKGFTLAVLGEFNTGAMHYSELMQYDVQYGFSALTLYNDRKPFIYPNSSYDDGSGKYVPNTSVYTKSANQELYSHFTNASANYLTKADFFKIREVVIGYERFFKTKTIKKLNLSVYGRNVFNFYAKANKSGDPQLIKGPGDRGYRTIPDNLSGSASGVSTVPGVAQYGVITTVSF
ncbi:TonB-linked outer membrane protein, SusC/RagA family [Chitinophaga ginsengisegetis]|uniref:TonB-linked outer membrane protein, SusC/RagA family n=1 Tax=Chitinophaga ginsengisegetis TaxID=393003 RepID=A0A1T5NUX5_9BACT|nr:SusC/RagA family TonB-linked outer membrane protein [Chitinophaga ginsengisegetis]SKD04196.1 TonB-linked outer membrane protein, SusC/RagA family [Chitinophaga ginsengisegetis]